MSEVSTTGESFPGTPGSSALDAAPSPRRRRRRTLGIAGLVLVAGAGTAVVSATTRSSGPSHPEHWDPRVVELVAFVEAERNLTFEHPVTVELLDPAEYEARVRAGLDDVDDEEADLSAAGAGVLRALGLAEGQLDLLAASEDLAADGSVGRYLVDAERIAIRATVLDAPTRAIVVHELTHALQDQHYDIGRRDDGEDDGHRRAVIEGDAEHVEDAWIEQLDAEAREELDRSRSSGGSNEPPAGVPESLLAFVLSDYTVGQDFVELLDADGGTDAIDAALLTPPATDEQLIDPSAYLDGDAAEAVDPIELGPGEVAIDDFTGEFGVLALYLLLAERVDPIAALRAVDGWGGDTHVAFERGGRSCVRIRIRGERDADTLTLERALRRWSEAMPAEAHGTVERRDTGIEVETCDPGVKADVVAGEGRSLEALRVLRSRSGILLAALDEGVPFDVAHCLVWSAIPALPYTELIADEWSEATNATFFSAVERAGDECRD